LIRESHRFGLPCNESSASCCVALVGQSPPVTCADPGQAACRQAPDEEIIKGYEHAKGHHVLIHPKELDELKLEAKHTIDMVRFVDEAEIDARYKEKP